MEIGPFKNEGSSEEIITDSDQDFRTDNDEIQSLYHISFNARDISGVINKTATNLTARPNEIPAFLGGGGKNQSHW